MMQDGKRNARCHSYRLVQGENAEGKKSAESVSLKSVVKSPTLHFWFHLIGQNCHTVKPNCRILGNVFYIRWQYAHLKLRVFFQKELMKVIGN